VVRSSRNELRWLRGLIEHLEHQGRTEELGNSRLRLHVTQAEINDMQGRDRNSGVVSRRCNRLRAAGVLEPGIPLVVRLDLLPNIPIFRIVDRDNPTPRPGMTSDMTSDMTADMTSPTLVVAAQSQQHGERGAPLGGTGAVEVPVPGCDTSLVTLALAEALQRCCTERRWELADRITTLLEWTTTPYAAHLVGDLSDGNQLVGTDERPFGSAASARFPDNRAANRQRTRDPRGSLDDDVPTSSSLPFDPREQRSPTRGTTSDQRARDRRQRADRLPPMNAPPSACGDDRVSAVEHPHDAGAGAGADVVVTAEALPTGSDYGEELLRAVEPLRVLCRTRGLPDLENLEVLRTAYPERMFERLAGDVTHLVGKIRSGTRVHNPFGLLVALARNPVLPDPDTSATATGTLTDDLATPTGNPTNVARPMQAVCSAADLLARQRALTGWDDLDINTPDSADRPDPSYVYGRLTELKARLRGGSLDLGVPDPR
jgi:hypothetical protein